MKVYEEAEMSADYYAEGNCFSLRGEKKNGVRITVWRTPSVRNIFAPNDCMAYTVALGVTFYDRAHLVELFGPAPTTEDFVEFVHILSVISHPDRAAFISDELRPGDGRIVGYDVRPPSNEPDDPHEPAMIFRLLLRDKATAAKYRLFFPDDRLCESVDVRLVAHNAGGWPD